jgi:hypothetical protein
MPTHLRNLKFVSLRKVHPWGRADIKWNGQLVNIVKFINFSYVTFVLSLFPVYCMINTEDGWGMGHGIFTSCFASCRNEIMVGP